MIPSHATLVERQVKIACQMAAMNHDKSDIERYLHEIVDEAMTNL